MNFETVMRANLLACGYALAKHRGCKLASISRITHGDAPFLDRLAAGKCSFTVRKYEEAMTAFRKLWPEGLAWPASVQDPKWLPVPPHLRVRR